MTLLEPSYFGPGPARAQKGAPKWAQKRVPKNQQKLSKFDPEKGPKIGPKIGPFRVVNAADNKIYVRESEFR